jgi:hypothetical protein
MLKVAYSEGGLWSLRFYGETWEFDEYDVLKVVLDRAQIRDFSVRKLRYLDGLEEVEAFHLKINNTVWSGLSFSDLQEQLALLCDYKVRYGVRSQWSSTLAVERGGVNRGYQDYS